MVRRLRLCYTETKWFKEAYRGESLNHIHTDEAGEAFYIDVYGIEAGGEKFFDAAFETSPVDPNFEKNELTAANRVIEAESQTEEGKKTLPNFPSSKSMDMLETTLNFVHSLQSQSAADARRKQRELIAPKYY